MKSFVIGIACVLLLVSFVPLVRGQEEQPVEQPPIIPPDLAESITSMGMGPIVSVVMAAGAGVIAVVAAAFFDVIDTVIAFALAGVAFILALIVDVIDTVIALGADVIDTVIALAYTAISTYSLWGLILGVIGITPILGDLFVWIKGITHVFLFIVRYIPLAGWFIRLWDFIKFLGGPIPII